jgi:sugar phosphate isomerase/epimerase
MRQVAPRVSVSEITTVSSSFADDLRAYADAGVDAVGLWELKLADGGDEEALELLEGSGLACACAVPNVPSILPLPLLGGPSDPAERLAALCASLERLAPFRPAGVVCLTGSGTGLDPDAAREMVVDGLRTAAAEAARLGLTVAIEPYQRLDGAPWSIVGSLGEAVELILDAGDPPGLGIQFDTWHLWNTPGVLDDIAQHVARFVGVHVADYREPTRTWCDRALPGEGIADLPRLLRALDEAGWDGPYDLELFSDDGTFGTRLEGSLWALPPERLLEQALDGFTRCWEASLVA